MRGRYLRAALRSVGLYALTMIAVVIVVFALPRAMPGDPLAALNDPDNAVYVNDQAVRDKVEAYYGLDKPLPQQFEHYVGRLARGDLGYSIARKRPVASLLRAHLPWTLLLMGVSIVLASLLSFVAGVAATWRRGRLSDRSLMTGMTVAQAIPEYALAAILLIAFAVVLPTGLPLAGARTPFVKAGQAFATLGPLALAKHAVRGSASRISCGPWWGPRFIARRSLELRSSPAGRPADG